MYQCARFRNYIYIYVHVDVDAHGARNPDINIYMLNDVFLVVFASSMTGAHDLSSVGSLVVLGEGEE